MALLRNYHNPSKPGSFGGVAQFARVNHISVGRAQRLLQNDWSYTLHRPRRKKFPTARVKVHGIDQQWAADLIEIPSYIAKKNKGVKFILTVVDVFSKLAWVQPLKSKTGPSVTAAFQTILRGGRKPANLQTDDGKEFYNQTFRRLLKQKQIHHFSTSGDTKASVVERFNRTLKQKMYRYFTAKNTFRFLDVLQDLVRGYNRNYHRSIKMAPDQVSVSNSSQVWDNLYPPTLRRQKRALLKVGDRVRLNTKFKTFGKSYIPGWTEEVFVVKSVHQREVPTYKIKEWDGTPVQGTFYNEDLQKVTALDDGVFRVEKVLKKKGNKMLVQWKGWPVKYNSWVDIHPT